MRRIVGAIALLTILGLVVMASDELSQTDGWTYDKNGRKRSKATSTLRHDVSGDGVIENVQLVGTNAGGDALVLGSVTNPGFAYFKNLNAVSVRTNGVSTNLIQVGAYDVNTNFVAFIRLDTNQSATVWLDTSAPRARATGTNSVKLDYAIMDR
jgi:hypothetical protein